MTGALEAHVVVRQPAQFFLDQREQLAERCLVAAAPLGEQLRDFVWCGIGHRKLCLRDECSLRL